MARDLLKTVEFYDKNKPDHPTKNLLSIMEETNFIAPKTWEGYRILTEK